jgi:predicted MPP superfamily phosphohydrolase
MMTRRKFLLGGAQLLALIGVFGYSLSEARGLKVTEENVLLPGLPMAFQGLRVVLIADIHHGAFFPRSYVRQVVALTNSLHPDLILLLGDYAYRDRRYIPAVMEELGGLRPKLGTYAVQGNHDVRMGRELTSLSLEKNGLKELTNTGVMIKRGDQAIFIAGIDDLQTGRPNLKRALEGCPEKGFAILMSHNPDVIEGIRDPRIHLVVSGHTHGGQICLPLIGSPVVPSDYGQKYRAGLVQGPLVKGYVTCGAGAIFPPIRIGCPPEISCLTFLNPDFVEK